MIPYLLYLVNNLEKKPVYPTYVNNISGQTCESSRIRGEKGKLRILLKQYLRVNLKNLREIFPKFAV